MSVRTEKSYEQLAQTFAERAVSRINSMDAIILYGSVARDEATERSDIDLLIVTDDIAEIRKDLSRLRTELDVQYGTVTTLMYRTLSELKQGLEDGDPFLREAVSEGILLYDRGIGRELRGEIPAAGL